MKKNILISLLISCMTLLFTYCMEDKASLRGSGLSDEEQLALAIQFGQEEESEKDLNGKQKIFTIETGEVHEQGLRAAMEDSSIIKLPYFRNDPASGLFAIFDGHGGDHVAKYIATHLINELENMDDTDPELLKKGLFAINEKLRHIPNTVETGSCAIVALLNGNQLTIANIGDSRAVLSRNGKALALSEDHNAENPCEKERIETLVGHQITGKRLAGPYGIAISRALGDFGYEQFGLVGTPEIIQTKINPETDFLILACDGIFEGGLDRQDAVDIVSKSLEDHKGMKNAATLAAQELMASALTGFKSEPGRTEALEKIQKELLEIENPRYRICARHALENEINNKLIKGNQAYKISGDNLSVIVVFFNDNVG